MDARTTSRFAVVAGAVTLTNSSTGHSVSFEVEVTAPR